MSPGTDPIYTKENLIYKNKIKGRALYLSVLTVIAVSAFMLPFINIDITRQSRGLVRTESENITIKTYVGGQLTLFHMDNNQSVCQGDTLLAISVDGISAEIAHIDSIILNKSEMKDDFDFLLQDRYNQIKTRAAKEDLSAYLKEKEMLQNDLISSFVFSLIDTRSSIRIK